MRTKTRTINVQFSSKQLSLLRDAANHILKGKSLEDELHWTPKDIDEFEDAIIILHRSYLVNQANLGI